MGAIIGTISYMSPEQARGKTLDARSDIFSMGSILHEMFTGAPAFKGATQVEMLGEIMHVNPPPPSGINALAPPAVDAIVVRCLVKDPDKRYQTMEELRIALEAVRDEMGPFSSSRSATQTFVAALPAPARSKAAVLGARVSPGIRMPGRLPLRHR